MMCLCNEHQYVYYNEFVKWFLTINTKQKNSTYKLQDSIYLCKEEPTSTSEEDKGGKKGRQQQLIYLQMNLPTI